MVGDSFEAMEISSSNAFARMMLFVKKLSSMSLCATWCLSVDGLAGLLGGYNKGKLVS